MTFWAARRGATLIRALLAWVAAVVAVACVGVAPASAATQTWALAHDFPPDGSTAPANPWSDSYGDASVWAAGYGGGGSYLTNSSGQVTRYSGLRSLSLAPASDWTSAEQGNAGVEAWNDAAGYAGNVHYPYVGKNTTSTSSTLWKANSAFMYPAPDTATSASRGVVRWVSPIQGTISISASFANTDGTCGDGVDYSVDHRSVYVSTVNTVAGGLVAKGATAAYASGTVAVNRGDVYLFSVGDGGHGDSGCDSTSVSITITGSSNPDALWSGAFGIPGLGNQVQSLATSGSLVYAGGTFTGVAGGVSGYNHIAEWNGTRWLPMGPGLNDQVLAIAVVGSNVYAGGWFTSTNDGTVTVSHLAKWNGSSWSPIGGGVGGNVYALTYHNGILYVGGTFTSVDNGTIAASNIAALNVSSGTWSTLGGGVKSCASCSGGLVTAMAWNPVVSRLFVTGSFALAGSTPAANFASWDGTAWHNYGTGLTASGSATGYALAVDATSGAVYVGGGFQDANGAPANNLAEVSTTGTWSTPGNITNTHTTNPANVKGLALVGSTLYVTGSFDTAGGVPAANLAEESGGVWQQVGAGLTGGTALAPIGSSVIAAGSQYAGSTYPYTGSPFLNYIGQWNGSAWSTFGQGIVAQISNSPTNAVIRALVPYGNGVYAGGQFAQTGGLLTNSIARWTGSGWSAMGGGLKQSNGTAGLVSAEAMIGSNLYVGGHFSSAGGVTVNNIAMWDGSAWHAVGPATVPGAGIDTADSVFALTVINGNLYVGGNFTSADGVAVSDIARYSPTANAWSALGADPTYANPGQGTAGDVRALANYGNRFLLIGGDFTKIDQTNTYGFADFDTTATSFPQPTSGYGFPGGVSSVVNAIVNAIVVMPNADVYVGGTFTHAGISDSSTGVAANNIADWQTAPVGGGAPKWMAVGQGTDGGVAALTETTKTASGTAQTPRVYLAGTFAHAGGSAAAGLATYTPSTGGFAPIADGLTYDPLNSVAGAFALAQNSNAGLFVGGEFRTAGARPSGGIALWTGTNGLVH